MEKIFYSLDQKQDLDRFVDSVSVLYKAGVSWDLFYETLNIARSKLPIQGESQLFTLSEWKVFFSTKNGVTQEKLKVIFDYHIHRAKYYYSPLPYFFVTGKLECKQQPDYCFIYAARHQTDEDKYYFRFIPEINTFRIEYLIFKCLE